MLIDLVDDVARSLRTGIGVRTALLEALEARPTVLTELRAALSHGASLPDALSARVEGATDDEVLVLRSLEAWVTAQGSLVDALDRVAGALRDREAFRRERAVHSAQARLSARVLTAVPLGFAVVVAATSPGVRHAYVHDPVAGAAAVLGLACNVAGWRWMRRLVQGAGT